MEIHERVLNLRAKVRKDEDSIGSPSLGDNKVELSGVIEKRETRKMGAVF